jgi:glycosyltransferase involved in cell wall biosynthesis
VSIALPVYNHAGYLGEAIDSIIAQDHPDLELVVVDDASTDGSGDILEDLLQRREVRSRFRTVSLIRHLHNAGAHHTLNEAVAATTADRIFLLNSDDAFSPGRVRTLAAHLPCTGHGFVFSRCAFINHRGLPDDDPAHDGYHRLVDFIRANLPSTGFGFLAGQWAISTGNFAFTRDLYRAVGGFQDLAYVHDWDFALQATLLTEPVFVDEPLYRYRYHPGNSFGSLGHLAGPETLVCLERFWRQGHVRRSANPLAPLPYNWPGLFEAMAPALPTIRHLATLTDAPPRYAGAVKT